MGEEREGGRGKTDESAVTSPTGHRCGGIVGGVSGDGRGGPVLLGSVRPRVRVPADVLVGVHDEDDCSFVLLRKEGERNQPSVVGLVFRLRVGRLIT